MKKKTLIIYLLTSLFALSGCGPLYLNPSKGDPIVVPEDESESESEYDSSEDINEIVDIVLYDNSTYDIGDIYDIDNNITYVVTYEDGTTLNTLPSGAILRRYDLISNSTGEVLDTSKPFSKVDTYTSKWRVTYDGYVYGPNDLEENNITIEVRSGFDNPDTKVESLVIRNNTKVKEGYKYLELFDYELDIYWKDLGKETITYSHSTYQSYPEISLSLNKMGSSDNFVNSELIADEEYQPILKINKNGETTHHLDVFKVYHGSYVLTSPDFVSKDVSISLLNKEINMNYTSAIGELNILVVPIKLNSIAEADHIGDMDESITNKLNSYFFDNSDNEVTSVKEYFETASFNRINIGGSVAPLYEEKEVLTEYASIKVEVAELQDQKLPVGLYQIFTGALNNAFNKMDEDWSKYDLDHDNRFDCIHFVTNYVDPSWGTTFWPQFGYKLDNVSIVGKLSKSLLQQSLPYYSYRLEENSIKGSIYALHTLQTLTDSYMAIHEQGHVFGLQDYYDYGGKYDYVGGGDMQSRNYFDYNSYSKFVVGWGNPIIIDGTQDEVTITLKPAATSGESIIIPANITTYNNTAFDEYFMLELFTNAGNNALTWDKYETDTGSDLGEGGIRLYHVDSRIVGCNSAEFLTGGQWYEVNDLSPNISETTSVIDNFTVGANNSDPYTSYAGYPYSNYKNFKLLSLIQAGGDNTFGSTSGRKTLDSSDFFKTGDSFTFDDAKSFLTKDNSIVSTMDNGESWNYTIEFIEVNANFATIKISK